MDGQFPNDSQTQTLMEALLDANTPPTAPTLPPGRRDALIEVLTRVLVDREHAAAFIDTLDANKVRRGVPRRTSFQVEKELPVDAICEHGLEALSDEDLVRLALDPFELLTTRDYLGAMEETGACGHTWFEAQCRESEIELAARGEAGLAEQVAREFVARAEAGTSGMARSRPSTHGGVDGTSALGRQSGTEVRRHKGWRDRLAWGGVGAALAATIMFWAFGQGSGPLDSTASATPGFVNLRGADVPQPTVTSPLGGYITVIAVGPDNAVSVWPTEADRPGRPVPIKKDAPTPVGPLSRGVTSALVVVTEQPATDPLLQEFGNVPLEAGKLSDLEARVRAHLHGFGYRRVAVAPVQFPPRP